MEFLRTLSGPVLTFVGIFLFQDATKVTDLGGIVGAVLGFVGVVIGLWQTARSQRLGRQLERAKIDADKNIEQTREVMDGWRELVRELKDGRALDRQHIVICERQQQYMQAVLLERGALKPADVKAMAEIAAWVTKDFHTPVAGG